MELTRTLVATARGRPDDAPELAPRINRATIFLLNAAATLENLSARKKLHLADEPGEESSNRSRCLRARASPARHPAAARRSHRARSTAVGTKRP